MIGTVQIFPLDQPKPHIKKNQPNLKGSKQQYKVRKHEEVGCISLEKRPNDLFLVYKPVVNDSVDKKSPCLSLGTGIGGNLGDVHATACL